MRQTQSLRDNKITVLLVDDHLVVREGLRTMLGGEADIEVVGEASTGDEAVRRAEELGPQVVLMDIRLPGMSGPQATRRIKQTCPTTVVIMLTMYDNHMYVIDSIRAGAAGYLTKDVSRDLLLHAIRSVLGGGSMVPNRLLRQAMDGSIHDVSERVEEDYHTTLSDLTPRELEVLALLGQGYDNKAISRELHLAEITIKKYVQSVIAKLGVSDRTQAALAGVRLGLVA